MCSADAHPFQDNRRHGEGRSDKEHMKKRIILACIDLYYTVRYNVMAVGARTIGTLACDEGNRQLDEKVTMKTT
jgi:hypothetical protein